MSSIRVKLYLGYFCITCLNAYLLSVPLTSENQQKFVRKHNYFRSKSKRGLNYLTLNESLATTARKIAEECIWNNDCNSTSCNQLGWRTDIQKSPDYLVDSWCKSSRDLCRTVEGIPTPNILCHACERVLSETATDIGCGLSLCSSLTMLPFNMTLTNQQFLVCMYDIQL